MKFLALLLLLISASWQSPDYDVLIRNARIVDGTGNPWYRADVGIRQGRIAAIGSLEKSSAGQVIDAAGRVLAPGFIDVHTHIETGNAPGGIERVPRGDNYLLDGVTTVVTGNCGSSETHIGPWFAELERIGIGLNVATLIGHNSVRSEVMGMENRRARPDEIRKMQALIETAMEEGAVGFSTGLLYVPGTYADTDEVVALAEAAARHRGVYASHIRDQGEKLAESIAEAVEVGKRAGMPVEISHFKVNGRRYWGGAAEAVALVERYRREGADVSVDQYPYDQASTGLSITVPSWALAGGDEKVRERIHDPAVRARIIAGMKEMLEKNGYPDYSYAAVASFAPDHSLEGKTISEISRAKGRGEGVDGQIDTILEILDQEDAQMIYHSMSMEDVERILRYSNTAVASDGGIQEPGKGMPHPRSYGTNARVLAEFVRRRSVLTLEDAVRRMTSLPAQRFRLHNRGMVYQGFAADLVIFDPARVEDRATYENPHQFAAGMDFVLVNGRLAVKDGSPTDDRAGQILRNGR